MMIRSMQPGDAPALREICAAALGHSAPEELLRQRISALARDPHYFISVCEAGGVVTGFLHGEKYDLLYGGNGWNIIALAVLPEYQGQGFGRQLLAAFEAHCRACGSGFIRLNSRTERTQAHLFYEHMGFVCDKVQNRFFKPLEAE